MSKTSASSLKNIDFGEDWSHSPIIEWLSSYKKVILWAFIALLAVLIIAYRFTAKQTLHAETDFFRAQNLFTHFQQVNLASEGRLTDFEQLETIMQSYPELKAKYEGSLAETLLITGQVDRARPLVEGIFKRNKSDHLQLYQDYTTTSLLIGEGQYAEALKQAQQLKQTLDQAGNEMTYSTLYTFNLIRLALLYQQLNRPQEELQMWEQLHNQTQSQRLETLATIDQAFKMGQVSLSRYIEERKKHINLNH